MEYLTDIKQIIAQFQIPGEFSHAEMFGNGHINDTFVAHFKNGNRAGDQYIVQRINHFVFKKPLEVMFNIEAVLAHLRQVIEASGGNPAREALTLIPTHQDDYLHVSPDNNYWRVYTQIENAQSYETPASQDHVYYAGKAFGDFQRLLADFPTDTMHETIVDFHNTPVRYQAFLAAVEADSHQRAAGAAAEIEFVRQRADELAIVMDAITQDEIPIRVTHNDTKFNNVMLDNHSGEAVCIVDLDTVMPGSLLFDFGDAIRSITNTAAEDEKDLNKVHFDLETYASFARGYLEAMGASITAKEYDLLPFSARLLTLECGMRFLTDHLSGDEYFRISREGHNLDRCRTQFKLVSEMEAQFPAMKQIVSQYAAPAPLPLDSFIG